MLQAMRSRAASWVVKILFVLLIISFGAWGIADYLRTGQAPTEVAQVGSMSITPEALSRSINIETQRYRQVLGQLTREQMKQFGVVDQALEQTVSRALLDLEAKRMGVTASDTLVRDTIRANPAFQGPGGFDRLRFQGMIAQAGYSEDGFVAELRRDLVRTQLLRGVEAGAVAPKILVDTLYKHRGEKRVVETLTLAVDAIGETPNPTDDDLKKFHETNSNRFSSPEYRSLSLLVLSPADLEGDVKPTEKDLQDAYAARLNELGDPEKRDVQQVLFQDEAAAKAGREKLLAGTPIADIAKEAGMAPDAVELGELTKDQLPGDLAETIFALEKDKVSDPLKTDFGWSVFRVSEIKAGTTPKFEDVREQIEAEVKQERAIDMVYDRSSKIEDYLATAGSLEEAATRFGLKVAKLAPIDRRGVPSNGTTPLDIAARDKVMPAAFQLEKGRTSPLIEAPGATFVAVRVDEITPSAVKPFDTVKAEVEAAWRADQRDQIAKTKADAIAAEVKAGKSMEEAGKALKLEPKTSEPFTREGTGDTQSLPFAVVSEAFAAKEAGAVTVARGTNAYVISKLAKIVPADEATADAAKDLASGTKDQLAGDLVNQYQTALRQHFPVKIDRKAVDQLF